MASICTRDTHPDCNLFEFTDSWDEIIVLEDGESPEDFGWRPTGTFGMPGRGRAMTIEDGRTIYVRSDRVGRDKDILGGIARERRYEILEPITIESENE